MVNIGSVDVMTIRELAAEIQEQLGVPMPLRATFVPYEDMPGNYQDVRERIPDTTKARELIGFDATVPVGEGLARTIDWHRERRLVEETLAS